MNLATGLVPKHQGSPNSRRTDICGVSEAYPFEARVERAESREGGEACITTFHWHHSYGSACLLQLDPSFVSC